MQASSRRASRRATVLIRLAAVLARLPTPALARDDMAGMDSMMAAMAAESLGDAGADLPAMMVPRHQSAIDMARVELAEGDDPEVQALAEEIIAVPDAGIAEMQAMLDAMMAE